MSEQGGQVEQGESDPVASIADLMGSGVAVVGAPPVSVQPVGDELPPVMEPVSDGPDAGDSFSAETPAETETPAQTHGITPMGFEGLRARVDAKKAAERAEMEELGSLDYLLDITPIRLKGKQFYISDPSLKQRRLLSDFFSGLARDQAREEDADSDMQVLKALCPYVCRFAPETGGLEPLTAAELDEVVGIKSLRRLMAGILGGSEPPAGPGDPNS